MTDEEEMSPKLQSDCFVSALELNSGISATGQILEKNPTERFRKALEAISFGRYSRSILGTTIASFRETDGTAVRPRGGLRNVVGLGKTAPFTCHHTAPLLPQRRFRHLASIFAFEAARPKR